MDLILFWLGVIALGLAGLALFIALYIAIGMVWANRRDFPKGEQHDC